MLSVQYCPFNFRRQYLNCFTEFLKVHVMMIIYIKVHISESKWLKVSTKPEQLYNKNKNPKTNQNCISLLPASMTKIWTVRSDIYILFQEIYRCTDISDNAASWCLGIKIVSNQNLMSHNTLLTSLAACILIFTTFTYWITIFKIKRLIGAPIILLEQTRHCS